MEPFCDGAGTRVVMGWVPGDPDTGMAGYYDVASYERCGCTKCKTASESLAAADAA